jgi:hypothetical protein
LVNLNLSALDPGIADEIRVASSGPDLATQVDVGEVVSVICWLPILAVSLRVRLGVAPPPAFVPLPLPPPPPLSVAGAGCTTWSSVGEVEEAKLGSPE